MPPLVLAAAQSPPLSPVDEYPNLNMTLNAIETGAERLPTLHLDDIFQAMNAAPDPIRVTTDALDERSVGTYPIFVQTTVPEPSQYFMSDRFPGSVGAHLEYPDYVKTTYMGGIGDNSEGQQDDPWRRGNVNKPHGISYSRLIDIITGQNRVNE